MENKVIFADRHVVFCKPQNKPPQKPHVEPRIRRTSDTSKEISPKKTPSGSGHESDTGLNSSIEYLNLSISSETKKNDSFFHLFSNDSANYLHQKKNVTIMEPNGHKVYPFKAVKKDKAYDGGKKISECSVSLDSFLDLSSANLTNLSKSVSKLTHLTHLYIYGNKIYKIPKEIGHLVNLKELWMQENDIHFLPMEMKGCKMIRHLDARHNHLNEECLAVVKYLTGLEILLFNNNKLSRLEGIGRLKKLETLSLKGNKLEGVLTKSLGKLVNLVSLDLSKNQIVAIPEEIGNCVLLRRLNLEYNKIVELPDSIGQLKKLEIIGIKYNRFETIPVSISDCENLKELNIENNLVSTIPNGVIMKLQQATKINISHNKFITLPQDSADQYSKTEKIIAEYNMISNLSGSLTEAHQLRVLNLCYNNLTEINSADIYNLKNLVDLNISFNHLKELPTEIQQLLHLESLDLTSNELRTIPKEIGQLRSLKFFNLESNYLESLPDELGLLEKLKNLNVSCNQLKTFPRCILKLQSLEILNISENLFQEIPESIGNLNQLTHLFLKDNKNLNDLPISLATMKILSFLSLSGCPLGEIPAEYTKSPMTVVAYLRALEIGLRLHQYLKVSRENKADNSIILSDTSLNNIDKNKNTTKVDDCQTVKPDKDSSKETEKSPMPVIRARSLSASAASKQNHLNSTNAKKSMQQKITVPDYLHRKMKTTEAGFLSCSKKDIRK